MAVYTKRWNGSSWVTAPFKKWNGSSWVDAYVYKWTGSNWFQLYPEPIAGADITATGSGLRTYRSTWSNWNTSKGAKQGNGNQQGWGGATANWGYLGVNCWQFSGCGSIIGVSTQQIGGQINGTGYYNNDITLHMYRGNQIEGGQPSVTGYMYSNTGGPGKNATMTTKNITGGEFQNFLNNASGYPYLYIYSNATGDYTGLSACWVRAVYQYSVAAAMFVDDGVAVAYNIPEDEYSMQLGGGHLYHKMPIYKDEFGLTLNEIMDRREQGIVEDIDPTTVNYMPEYIKPWFKERDVYKEDDDTKFKIEVKNMGIHDEAQYSLDNTEWNTLYGNSSESNPELTDYVYATMPNDFNMYSDFIYVRIVDKDNDMILNECVVEPRIYVPDMKTRGLFIPGYEIDIDNMLGDDNEFKKNE